MKKFLKFFIILVICLLIFAIMDCAIAFKLHLQRMDLYNSLFADNYGTENVEGFEKYNLKNFPFEYSWKLKRFQDYFYRVFHEEGYTMTGNPDSTNAPVLLLGCSFAWGSGLNDNEKFGYLISKYTDRLVYNMGWCAMGPEAMLFQVENEEVNNYIKQHSAPPEYAIYVYISSHMLRMYDNKYALHEFNTLRLGYNQRKGRLILNKGGFYTFLSRFAIGKCILDKYCQDKIFHTPYIESLFRKYMLQTREELQKRYPNIKFIILKFPQQHEYDEEEDYTLWNQLKKDGFIVYDLKKELDFDITATEYLLPDAHPNAKAWEIITPKFIKDVNL